MNFDIPWKKKSKNGEVSLQMGVACNCSLENLPLCIFTIFTQACYCSANTGYDVSYTGLSSVLKLNIEEKKFTDYSNKLVLTRIRYCKILYFHFSLTTLWNPVFDLSGRRTTTATCTSLLQHSSHLADPAFQWIAEQKTQLQRKSGPGAGKTWISTKLR